MDDKQIQSFNQIPNTRTTSENKTQYISESKSINLSNRPAKKYMYALSGFIKKVQCLVFQNIN
jgi:hypothetical protein